MKAIIIGLLGLVIVGGLVNTVGTQVSYEKSETATSTDEVAKTDVLDEAQSALDAANKLLDEEEARLLEKRDKEKAQYEEQDALLETKQAELKSLHEAELEQINARLDEIVKKRTAF